MAQQAQSAQAAQPEDELTAALPGFLKPYAGLARLGLGIAARYFYQVEQACAAETRLGRPLTFAERLSLPKLRDILTEEVCKAPSTAMPGEPGEPGDLVDLLRSRISPEELAVFMSAAGAPIPQPPAPERQPLEAANMPPQAPHPQDLAAFLERFSPLLSGPQPPAQSQAQGQPSPQPQPPQPQPNPQPQSQLSELREAIARNCPPRTGVAPQFPMHQPADPYPPHQHQYAPPPPQPHPQPRPQPSAAAPYRNSQLSELREAIARNCPPRTGGAPQFPMHQPADLYPPQYAPPPPPHAYTPQPHPHAYTPPPPPHAYAPPPPPHAYAPPPPPHAYAPPPPPHAYAPPLPPHAYAPQYPTYQYAPSYAAPQLQHQPQRYDRNHFQPPQQSAPAPEPSSPPAQRPPPPPLPRRSPVAAPQAVERLTEAVAGLHARVADLEERSSRLETTVGQLLSMLTAALEQQARAGKVAAAPPGGEQKAATTAETLDLVDEKVAAAPPGGEPEAATTTEALDLVDEKVAAAPPGGEQEAATATEELDVVDDDSDEHADREQDATPTTDHEGGADASDADRDLPAATADEPSADHNEERAAAPTTDQTVEDLIAPLRDVTELYGRRLAAMEQSVATVVTAIPLLMRQAQVQR